MIPYGRQDISDEDVEAVVRVLRSDYLTQGPEIEAFEASVAAYVGASHAVAVNSATSALHIACAALDIGPGDRVWTSPNSFTASANCARYCGADVDFVDIDTDLNMSVRVLEDKLRRSRVEGTLPRAIVPVDFAGRSCRLAEMRELANEYGFAIIEDASHAIGATYLDQHVGGHGLSDVTVFSFHPLKIITSGEGGMAVTHNAELAQRMRRLRSHGITRDPAQMTHEPDGPWYYQQVELGFNYRLTDIHAALGRSQLMRVDDLIARRQQIRMRYDRELARCGLVLPAPDATGRSALHLYPVRVPGGLAGGRQQVFTRLRERGIGVNVLYIPIHTQPYYLQFGFQWGDFPEAEAYYRETVALPMYAGMSDKQVGMVIEATLAVVSEA